MVHAGTAAINKWTVSWTWPGSQSLTQAWNGTASSPVPTTAAATGWYAPKRSSGASA